MECSICLTAVVQEEKKTTACKHTFHKDCLDEWTKAHNTCPLCRQSIEHAPRIFPLNAPPFLPPMSAPLSSWFSRTLEPHNSRNLELNGGRQYT